MIQVHFLGNAHYKIDDHVIEPPLRRKTHAILAYLCLADKPLRRDDLASLFFQNSDDPIGNLRWHISRIRRGLDADVLQTVDNKVQVNFERVWCDARQFTQILAQNNGRVDIDRLETTLAYYRGELLAGLNLPDIADFELWLLGQRSHYARLYDQFTLRLVQRLVEQSNYQKALHWVQQLQHHNPTLEDVHYWLMWLYAYLGQRETAMQQYALYEQIMVQEFGTRPGERILELCRQIKRNELPDKQQTPPIVIDPAETQPDKVFVGRRTEQQQLQQFWQQAEDGRGVAIVIEGEAGIGKSALVSQFTSALAPVWMATCYESTSTLALAPWVTILRQALQDVGSHNVPEVVTQRLRLLVPELLSDEVQTPQTGLDATLLLNTVADFIAIAAHQTLPVIVIEDFHFIDEFSTQLMTMLLHRMATAPIFMLLTQRPLEASENQYLKMATSEWMSDAHFQQLPLAELSHDEVVNLIHQIIPAIENKAALADLLIEHTTGLSLHIAELLYEYQAQPERLYDLPIPRGFAQMVDQRLQKLSESQRQILEALAVFEYPASVADIVSITAQNEISVMQSLDNLIKLRYIKMVHDGQYTFTHFLFRDAIVDALSALRKKLLHRLSAEHLEKQALIQTKETRHASVDHLVHHARLANDVERLVRWTPIAAQHAKDAFAYRVALSLYENLDTALQQSAPISVEGYAKLLLEIADLHDYTGDWNAQATYLQRLEEWYQQGFIEEPYLIYGFLVLYGTNQMRLGDYENAKDYLCRAIEPAQTRNASLVLAKAYNNLGVIAYYQSEWDMAADYYSKSITLMEVVGDEIQIGKLYNNLGIIAYHKDDYALAGEYYRKNLAIREKHNDQHGIATCLNNLGTIYMTIGELDEAHDYYQRALDIRRDLDDQHGAASAMANMAQVFALRGQYDAALECCEQSLRIRTTIGDKFGIAHSLNCLGQNHIDLQDYAKAIDYLAQSLAIRKSLGDKFGQAEAQIGLCFAKALLANEVLDQAFYDALRIGYELDSDHIMFSAITRLAELLIHQAAYTQAAEYAGLVSTKSQDGRRGTMNRMMASLKDKMGGAAFEQAAENGAKLDVRVVVQQLLAAHV